MNQTKFQEELNNQQFWYDQDPQIKDLSYLKNYQNTVVDWIELQKDRDFQNQSYYQYYQYINVLFLPTFLYKQQTFNKLINEKNVNLLDCMYSIRFADKSQSSLIISLQEFVNERQIHISYKYVYQDFEENQKIGDISTAILGGQYLVLVVEHPKNLVIKVFNLDLTLHFEYSKEFFQSKKFLRYEYRSNKNLETHDMDYCEPGIIYYFNRYSCFRIDLSNQTVIEKMFEIEEEDTFLMRLLPITSNEFEYYFKNSKKESLKGYKTGEKEDKLILFVILGKVIYQLNMHNLEIIRTISQNSSISKQKFKVNVIPLQLKHRQKKEFSQWCFIKSGKDWKITLFDWREKNLFQLKNTNNSKGCENNNSLQLSQQNRNDQNFSGSISRFIYHNDSVYILQKQYDNSLLYELKVEKQKGCKNYSYSLRHWLEENEDVTKSNYSCLLSIQQFCSPILYKGEITFPALLTIHRNENYISNLITFNSFKKQALIQQSSLYKQSTINAKDIFNFNIINQKRDNFQIHDDDEYQYIFQKQYYRQMNKHYLWSLYKKSMDVSYQQFNNFYYSEEEEIKEVQKAQIKTLQKDIIMFSEKIQDLKTNEHYLPMIFKKESEGDTFFGIFDLTKDKIIEQTLHRTKYANQLHTLYDKETKQLIVLLTKKIESSGYIYIYTLDMRSYEFKFINLLYKSSFHFQDEDYLTVFPCQGYLGIYKNKNTLLLLNDKRKFEIEYEILFSNPQHFYDHTDEFDLQLVKIFGENDEQYLQLFVQYVAPYFRSRGYFHYSLKQKQIILISNA